MKSNLQKIEIQPLSVFLQICGVNFLSTIVCVFILKNLPVILHNFLKFVVCPILWVKTITKKTFDNFLEKLMRATK